MSQVDKDKNRMNVLYLLSGVVPAGVSISMDIGEAEKILDAAREANSAFEHMSDAQIIHYCQGLGDAELDGMVSLVHGRYFENVVVEETGGVLFDAQNHEDTDMVLGGAEISIKSNDATADSITEFETLSPQDFGMDDAELRERTTEVMDGDIIDATDALISGTIGAGTLAMIQAAGKTIEEWEELSEYEKTNVRAAWYGTKATARAAIGTAKSTWGLTKLIGKGLKKGYQAHKEFKDSGGYEKLKNDISNDDKIKERWSKSKDTGYDHTSVAIDWTSDNVSKAIDASLDFFTDDEPTPKIKPNGYSSFRKK